MLLIVSSRILITHFFVLKTKKSLKDTLNGNKISRCTDNPLNRVNNLLYVYGAVTGFRGTFTVYLTWIMTVPNFQFAIFVVVQ